MEFLPNFLFLVGICFFLRSLESISENGSFNLLGGWYIFLLLFVLASLFRDLMVGIPPIFADTKMCPCMYDFPGKFDIISCASIWAKFSYEVPDLEFFGLFEGQIPENELTPRFGSIWVTSWDGPCRLPASRLVDARFLNHQQYGRTS